MIVLTPSLQDGRAKSERKYGEYSFAVYIHGLKNNSEYGTVK